MAFKKEEIQFLEQLLSIPSPTGYEAEGQRHWLSEVSKYSDEQLSDVYGSTAARLNVDEHAITVMLEAHADEIGMVVQYIDDSGYVYVTRLGGSDSTIARARRVFIHTRKGTVQGIIGNTAIHLQPRDGSSKPPQWKDVFLDIGATNREEALSLVQVGDPITYAGQAEWLSDTILTGRALDNRIGGFIIAMALKKLHAKRKKLKVNVIAMNSVQEEIGGFGAKMMGYRLRPDVAIITDVTHATDTPGINVKEHGSVKLGAGPAVTHGAGSHPLVVRHIEAAAAAAKISLQHEAAGIRTGTDTDNIYDVGNGIACGLISLPLRYMHSPVEMASIDDVEQLVNLMTESVLSLESNQSFNLLNL